MIYSRIKTLWDLSLFPYFIILVPVVAGMFLDVMDIDSAQYAAISKEMYNTGSYLQVFERGHDYLDKPPLLFWFSSMMFSFFGVHHFVFRLLPVAVSFLGVYATYRFTLQYYNEKSARYAALIFASCQAFFLMNHDVRTDTMLTGFTICAIWLISSYIEMRKMQDLVFGSICISLALLAKGPIGLMVPVLGLGGHLVLKKKWKSIFDINYLIVVLIVGILLFPMCLGLYLQFDTDPAKESGLYFYFWKQSFGRLTGENVWSNNPSPTFLAENLLWSFLPWTLIFIPAFVMKIKRLFYHGRNQGEEFISLFGFLLPFIALSTSRYQLPHYIFILFPLAAVITGIYLESLTSKIKQLNILKTLQGFIFLLVIALIGLLGFWSFKGMHIVLIICLLALMIAGLYLLIVSKNAFHSIILSSVIFISAFNLFMNVHFYPAIFKFQSGSVVGKYFKEHELNMPEKLLIFGKDLGFSSFDFYSDVTPQKLKYKEELNSYFDDTFCLYTNTDGLDYLKSMPEITYKTHVETSKFHISTLTGQFLNPTTRLEACEKVYLIEVAPK